MILSTCLYVRACLRRGWQTHALQTVSCRARIQTQVARLKSLCSQSLCYIWGNTSELERSPFWADEPFICIQGFWLRDPSMDWIPAPTPVPGARLSRHPLTSSALVIHAFTMSWGHEVLSMILLPWKLYDASWTNSRYISLHYHCSWHRRFYSSIFLFS